MDFPDIVRDDGPVGGAVTAPPLESGDLEAAAGQATRRVEGLGQGVSRVDLAGATPARVGEHADHVGADRKSTRLNSSHLVISYAVFCLKKKKQNSSAS